MNDKDFESIWRSSAGSDLVTVEQQSLLHDLSKKINRLDKTIGKRNTLEIFVSVLLILAFCIIAYLVPYTLTKIASLLMIPYYLFYMYKIEGVRRQKSNDFSQTPKQFLVSQKKYIREEKKLLDTVSYWALLPLAFILILFYAGFPMDLHSYLSYGGFTIAVLLAVYWANKYAAQKTFGPLLQNLDEIIHEFDKDEQKPE